MLLFLCLMPYALSPSFRHSCFFPLRSCKFHEAIGECSLPVEIFMAAVKLSVMDRISLCCQNIAEVTDSGDHMLRFEQTGFQIKTERQGIGSL